MHRRCPGTFLRWPPLLAPSLGFAAGVAAGLGRGPDFVELAGAFLLALCLLSLAVGRSPLRGAWSAVAGVLGCLWSFLAAPAPFPLDRDLAVRAEVAVETPWSATESFGGSTQWRARARLLSVRQGLRVARGRERLWLRLQAEAPPRSPRLRVRGFVRPAAVYLNEGSRAERTALRSMSIASPRLVEEVAAPRLSSAALRCHQAVAQALDRGFDEATSAILAAVMLGRTDALPDGVTRSLRVYGLGHLLALSGLHLAVALGGALVWLRGPLRRLRWGTALVVAAAYVLMTGARPSLLRAAAMTCVAVTALACARRAWSWSAWAAALGALLIARPGSVAQPGAQLSFLATAGILATGSSARQAPLAGPLRLSIATQIATWPVALPRFGVLALGAPGLNLLFVPGVGLLILGGWAWVILGAVPGAPATLLTLGTWALEALASVLWRAGTWRPRPWLNVHARPESLALLGGVLFLPAMMALQRPPRRAAGLALAALLGLLDCGVQRSERLSLRLDFFDVGQGDAALLRSGGVHVLVDGGGWSRDGLGARVLVPALLEQGVRQIDLMVLSHADRDHCGGLVEVAARLRVRELWIGPEQVKAPCGVELAHLVAGQRGKVRHPRVAEVFALPTGRLRVLAGGHPGASRNDASLVLEAELIGRRLLFLGDVSRSAEMRLAQALGPVAQRLDVLKVAHHGSRTSTAPALLRSLRPRVALIGVGRHNVYGHPAPQVCARLARAGAAIYRTDLHGHTIVEASQEGPLRIRTVRTPRWGEAPRTMPSLPPP